VVTIKDVAKRARVSITSASYALNGRGTISESTRKRILAAAEELNYHPNAFARHLRNKRTKTIGVFITRFGGSFYEEILEGIHDAILKTEYELLVCPESRDIQKILTHRQVDGAIIFDTTVKSDIILRLASSTYPIIVLDRYLEGDHILPILVDNRQGTLEAFYHLFDQGARRITFVSGSLDSYDNMERMNTFLAEAEEHGINVQCYYGNFTSASGYDVARVIIQSNDYPQAVFCANDQMAIGFITCLQENNIAVPDEIAVVGFDDIQIARYIRPSLTTVGVSRFTWGSLAATQMINYLDHEEPFEYVRIPTRLIVRESSKIKLR
jgi:LacI family transcriptional regulator